MKIFTSKNSIYFCGKVKELKKELEQYKNTNYTVEELIKLKLS